MPVPRPLNIGLLAPSFRGFNALDGGIGSHFADLAAGLSAEGHLVRVITPAPGAGCPDPEPIPGVRFVTFDSKLPRWLHHATRWRWQAHTAAGWLWRARQAASTVLTAHAAEPFDCIETSSSGLLALTLLRSRHRPPVVTRISTTAAQLVAHNAGASRWIERLEQRWEKTLVMRSDALLTHTRSHRDELVLQWALKSAAVHLIPHGIAMHLDSSPAAVNERPPRLLYVGRFEHRKGIDVLLAAIPAVLAAAPTATFDLIGQDHADYWQHRFWTENPDISRSQVRFHGKAGTAALLSAYRDCDVFVAPSRYESFGLIYVEAMAWGKPVVGCRAGGIPEVVAEGETGLLAEPGDVTGLRDALIRLCRDGELRARLGRQAREHAAKHFSREVLARRSAALYAQTMAGNTRRPPTIMAEDTPAPTSST
jgi:glycosyltransferase involved in cell wall biosynthesis